MFFTGVINLYLWCDLIYSEMWKLLELPAFTSCRSVRMYTATKSFERFRQPKSVEDEKKSVDNVVVYGFRGMGTESIGEILYFGTRRPFYHERLWRRSSNFGHGYYRYVCMQCELLAVEVRSRSKQLFWGTLSFPFVVFNYLRTEAPSFWCKCKCCIETFGRLCPRVPVHKGTKR